MRHSWFHWLRSGSVQQRTARTHRTSRPRRSFLPQVLVLEDRTVPSTLTVLNSADSGAGSLRDTLVTAQSGDTIVFDNSLLHQTITLTSGPLALRSNCTIDGPSADLLALSGNNQGRIFELSGSAQVTLAYLTLTQGVSSQGGAVLVGGTASLTLYNDILSDNQAVGDTNGNALGGAIYNSAGASLTIDNTAFVNNQTNGTNNSFGGAIANAGTLSMNGASFTANASLGSTSLSQGGAVGNLYGATSTIKLSTFVDNQALGNGAGSAIGGALCNGDALATPPNGSILTSTMSQCTFDNNTAQGGSASRNGGFGGAMENNSGVNLVVLNCSFTSNQAISGGGPVAEGGAIDTSPAVTVTISSSQFLSNAALATGVGATAFGGAVINFQTMTIDNALFTGNRAVGGPMADGSDNNHFGQAQGGAIESGYGLNNGVTVILSISNSIIAGNEAIAGSGGSTLAYPRTDSAIGGGIVQPLGGTLNVAGCTITGNQAIGGATTSGSGGIADGGGIANVRGTLNLTNSTVSANFCQGGQGADGYAGGQVAGVEEFRDFSLNATVFTVRSPSSEDAPDLLRGG